MGHVPPQKRKNLVPHVTGVEDEDEEEDELKDD